MSNEFWILYITATPAMFLVGFLWDGFRVMDRADYISDELEDGDELDIRGHLLKESTGRGLLVGLICALLPPLATLCAVHMLVKRDV